MNDTDHYVIKVIQGYYDIHGKYPPRVEVSEDLRCQMTRKSFVFAEITSLLHSGTIPPSGPIKRIEIPVVPVGDDVARPFYIRQVGIDIKDAQRNAEMHYNKIKHYLEAKNANVYIFEEVSRQCFHDEKQYICDVYGVAYGHETILKDLKKIIRG